jgi:outer membrane protein insertion porin family
VLSLQGTFGWSEEHHDTDDVPIFERFFVGGVSGTFPLRGFKYRGVGPHENGEPIGGSAATAFSLEYSIPLISEYDPFFDTEDPRLKGVFFVDAGNVVEDIHDSDMFGKLRSSYGAGLRISLPVMGGLPISIYYGIPWKKYDDDERRSFNINISTNF